MGTPHHACHFAHQSPTSREGPFTLPHKCDVPWLSQASHHTHGAMHVTWGKGHYIRVHHHQGHVSHQLRDAETIITAPTATCNLLCRACPCCAPLCTLKLFCQPAALAAHLSTGLLGWWLPLLLPPWWVCPRGRSSVEVWVQLSVGALSMSLSVTSQQSSVWGRMGGARP